MSFKQMGICLLVAICLFGAGAHAIKCYQCESISNSACGEKMNADMLQIVDCSKIPRPRYIVGNKNSTSCVKMIKEDRGRTNVVRACFFENAMDTKSKCLIDPNAQSVYKSCDLCQEDVCNGSSSIYGSIVFVAAIASSILTIRTHLY